MVGHLAITGTVSNLKCVSETNQNLVYITITIKWTLNCFKPKPEANGILLNWENDMKIELNMRLIIEITFTFSLSQIS